MRKQLTLLKDIMTRDVLLTRNFHLLCKYLRLNRKSSSHNLTISAGHASLCLVFGIVRLVHLDWAFHNFLWVHLQLNTFHCDSPSPLSDLSIAHHSPHLRGGQELQQQVLPVNPGIGKCGNVCGDRVRRQNPLGKNVTNFTKSHDLNWARLAT